MARNTKPGSTRRIRNWLGIILAIVVVGVTGFWAGRTTVAPPAPLPTSAAKELTTSVTEATVGRMLNLNTRVETVLVPVAENSLSGVVTFAGKSGEYVAGQALYSVSGTPVRVIPGSTPFYRPLSAGIAGPDVAQLNAFLKSKGYKANSGSKFDWRTKVGVKAWQKKLGQKQTGVIAVGEIMAIPKLPARLRIDTKNLYAGKRLQGGENLVSRIGTDVGFTVSLQREQVKLIPSDAKITVRSGDKAWPAKIAKIDAGEEGNPVAKLTGPDGGTICGDDCGTLPLKEDTYLPCDIELVPAVTGPAVPVAAIKTGVDGKTSVLVVNSDGTRTETPVTVKESQDGMAVVSGVKVGTKIVFFAREGEEPGPNTSNNGQPPPEETPPPEEAPPSEITTEPTP